MSNRLAEILKQSYVTRTSGYLDVTVKTELFKEIAEISGGTFSKSHNPGSVLSTLRIAIPYKDLEIVLTESDTRPLRFEVDLKPLLDYVLVIGIEDVFDRILKQLGKAEFEVGDKVFDNQYLIHTNNPALTGKLLTENIRSQIQKHNLYNISYLTHHKKERSELTSVVSRTIEDKETYLDLINLHQMLVDSLLELEIIGRG